MAIEYKKGTSYLHRLDARSKILMFAIATLVAVVVIDPVLMGILFLLLYLMGRKAVDPSQLNKNLRVLVVIFFTFSMFQILFFTPECSFLAVHALPSMLTRGLPLRRAKPA